MSASHRFDRVKRFRIGIAFCSALLGLAAALSANEPGPPKATDQAQLNTGGRCFRAPSFDGGFGRCRVQTPARATSGDWTCGSSGRSSPRP